MYLSLSLLHLTHQSYQSPNSHFLLYLYLPSLLVFSLLALSSARALGYEDEDPYGYNYNPNYKYDYGVSSPLTGDEKAQKENRDGQKVNGEYALRESDGTTRLVQYKSSPQAGFEAIVQRAGVAVHPALGLAPVFSIQTLGQALGNQGYGAQVKPYGGPIYDLYKYGVQVPAHALGGQGLQGFQGYGGQALGGQALGGQALGGLLGGLGNSYVGTTRWGNQGPEHGGYGHDNGLGHGYGY